MDEKKIEAVGVSESSGRLPVEVSVSFADMLDELRSFVGDLNHNLNPFPDEVPDPLSWDDRLDRVGVNFSVAAAMQRVYARLAPRGARLQLTVSAARISLSDFPAEHEFSYLIVEKIKSYVRLSVEADKLNVYAGKLECADRLRDQLRADAQETLFDLSAILCLLDNRELCL